MKELSIKNKRDIDKTIRDLDITDQDNINASLYHFVEEEKHQDAILDFQKILFVITLVRYFHDNPDAILYVQENIEETDDYTEKSSVQYFYRVDAKHVHESYPEDSGFAGYGKNTHNDFFTKKGELRALPYDFKNKEKLIVKDFDEFYYLDHIWEGQDGSMIYSKNNINAYLADFYCGEEKLFEIISIIEKKHLEKSIKNTTVKSSDTADRNYI